MILRLIGNPTFDKHECRKGDKWNIGNVKKEMWIMDKHETEMWEYMNMHKWIVDKQECPQMESRKADKWQAYKWINDKYTSI